MMADGDGDGSLADAADADDAHETGGGQLSGELEDVLVAPNHAGQSAGQAGVRKTGHNRRARIVLTARPGDRSDEAIAPPGRGGDIARAAFSIAQRPAQGRDVEAQTAFLNRDVGPDPGQKLPFADDLVGAGRQGDQGVNGARAQFDRRAVVREKTLAHRQAERTKRQDVPGLIRRSRHGVFPVPPSPLAS